ncbi:MAG: hypothetical protein ABR567_10770 [Myxococcales bacterium]|nr:hypothetical protein [Myxococcales bacterium]
MTPLLCAFALLASDAWMLFHTEERVTMSGDLSNLKSGQRLFKKFGPHFLWFRHAGKEYVVRDGKVLEKADQLTAGDGETEAREAILDEADAELDRHQQKLDKNQALIEKWQDRGVRDEKLQRAQEDLQKAQEQVTREQEKVSKKQEKLGKAEEKRAREMERKMAELIASSLRDGTAQEVR